MRCLPILALLLLLGLSLGIVRPSRGSNTDKLLEMSDRWRSTRAGVRPLENYLRTLVAEDSLFSHDPELKPDRLGPEMRTLYFGLEPILSPTLRTQFLGFSNDSLRVEWVRRFWRLRDPTPTTPANERRAEHERRLETAQREFAAKEPPGWDARGTVLIQFGAPDSIIEEGADVEHGLGYVPARQDWLYIDEAWVAAFERPKPRGPWVLGAPVRLSRRPDVVRDELRRLGFAATDQHTASGRDRKSDLLGQDEERRILAQKDLQDSQLDPEIIEHEVRNDFRAREMLRKRDEAVWAFQKEYDAGRDRFWMQGEPRPRLWFVFDVDVFKGPVGRMRIEVHYQFNIQDLTFGWQDSLYVSRYVAEGVLLDHQAREIARDSYSENLTAAEFRSTLDDRLYPGQLQFDVAEGAYRLAVRIADAGGRGEGTYLTDLDVPRLDGRELALSDVEMATKIIYADPSWHPRFVKKDRLVVPNPIGVYRRSGPLLGLYEIYGLDLDANGVCRYQVTYSIVPRSLRRADGWFPPEGKMKRPFVTATFTYEGGASEIVEDLRVDIATLDEDIYDLELTVVDLVGGGRATQRTAFTILQ
ncbi:MAG TPA: GWxTD domain-containing protein [Candidatus Krumholzibacteria bacterium]|nr:GWxTD domain-containing protein [Candidatus Krumholzibacteria bacterium]